MTASGARSGGIPLILGSRAVAAGLILIVHVGYSSFGESEDLLNRLIARGGWGVALFFALSGFLLSRGWARAARDGSSRPDLRRYAWHRFLRIMPAYWAALAVIVVTVNRDAQAVTVVQNVFLLQVYTGGFLDSFFLTWSLCTEVAFYAVLPLLAPMVMRRRARHSLALIGLVALVAPVAIWLATDMHAALAIAWLPAHLDWFAAGMALAVVEPWIRGSRHWGGPRWLHRPSVWMVAAVGGVVLSAAPFTGPVGFEAVEVWQRVVVELLFAVTTSMFLIALLLPGSERTIWGRALDSRTLRWAGTISYAVFLWQMLMIQAARGLLDIPYFTGGFWPVLVVSVLLTLAVAQVSWWVIESPMTRLMHRIAPASPRLRPEPGPAELDHEPTARIPDGRT